MGFMMAYGVVVPAGLYSWYGLDQNYNETNHIVQYNIQSGVGSHDTVPDRGYTKSGCFSKGNQLLLQLRL